MIFHSPNEVEEMIGVSPDILRDWRRRGLTHQLGVIRTPNGGWTRRADDPALAQVKRPAWVYPTGDLAALASARQLQDLGLDIASALQIAMQMNSMILIRAFPSWAKGNYPQHIIDAVKTDFVIAIKGSDTLTLEGIPLSAFTVLQVTDFAKVPEWVSGKALIINAKTVGSRWPAPLRRLFEGG